MKKSNSINYAYDDHSSIPFKLVVLKPSEEPEPENPHRHNFFQIFFFTKNGGKHVVDFEEMDCLNSYVHIVNPGSIHMMTRTSATNGFVLLFSRSFFNQDGLNPSYFLSRNDFNKFVNIPEKRFEALLLLIHKIQLEQAEDKAFSDRAIKVLLELIIIEIQRNITFKSKIISDANDLIFNDFKILLDQNFNEHHNISFYTKTLHISKQKLDAVCKSKLNKSANSILQERIILEAKRLLFYSNQSIKEIAFQLAYEDPSYFNRFFKRQVNETPKEFRISIREKYH